MMSNLIQKICSPTQNNKLTDLQRQLTYERNKDTLFMLLCIISLLFLTTLNIYLKNLAYTNGVIVTLLWTGILIVFIITCRSYILIFKASIFLITFLVPYYTVISIHASAISMWSNNLVMPVIVYYFTDSKKLLGLSISIQIYLTRNHYNFYLEEQIMATSVQQYVRQSTVSSTFGLLFLGALFYLIERKSAREYRILMRTDTKRIDSENKNIYLLSFFHELRNILGQIINNTSLMEIKNLKDENRIYLQNIRVCSNLLHYLSNAFLDISKVERGSIDIIETKIDTKQFFNEFWGVASSLVTKKGIRADMNIAHNLPSSINIDSYRLFQVLLNIITNSSKYTDKGSINMYINWASNKRIDERDVFEPQPFQEDGIFEKQNCVMKHLENSIVYTEKQEGILKLTITDTGSGISDLNLNKMFEMFEQLSEDSNQRRDGLGLGLYISKQLCQLMKGKIQVISKKGIGTAFSICIPCSGI